MAFSKGDLVAAVAASTGCTKTMAADNLDAALRSLRFDSNVKVVEELIPHVMSG